MINRRKALQLIGGASASVVLRHFDYTDSIIENQSFKMLNSSIEEIQKRYNVDRSITNLENGYFGVMTEYVKEKYIENINTLNKKLSVYARLEFSDVYKQGYEGMIKYLGIPENSFIFTRNATEALNISIQGISLNPGDEVVISQLDYTSALDTWLMLEKTKKIVLKKIELPIFPSSNKEISDLYSNAISSKTKVVHLTHLNHITGLILPVKEILEKLPSNVISIVDAAHSFEQIDFNFLDLNADMIVVNFHKWFGSPIGLGGLYIRPSLVPSINPLYGKYSETKDDNIRKLNNFGTLAIPNIMTISDVLKNRSKEEVKIKQEYLHGLKKRWVEEFNKNDKLELFTPMDAKWSCSIASFKFKNKDSNEVQKILLEKYKILTVARKLNDDTIIRVTPHVYNRAEDIENLISAVGELC